jgi:hypothetical protein
MSNQIQIMRGGATYIRQQTSKWAMRTQWCYLYAMLHKQDEPHLQPRCSKETRLPACIPLARSTSPTLCDPRAWPTRLPKRLWRSPLGHPNFELRTNMQINTSISNKHRELIISFMTRLKPIMQNACKSYTTTQVSMIFRKHLHFAFLFRSV